MVQVSLRAGVLGSRKLALALTVIHLQVMSTLLSSISAANAFYIPSTSTSLSRGLSYQYEGRSISNPSCRTHISYLQAEHRASEDEDGSLSSPASVQDPVLMLPIWRSQLAVLKESSSKSKEEQQDLQAKIDQASTAAEFGIRKAQLEFYEAFSKQDLDKMKNVWAGDTDGKCECIHPGMASIEGKQAIMASWAIIFQSPGFAIEPIQTRMEISGPTAICRCVEQVVSNDEEEARSGPMNFLEAVNVYRREKGQWKMTMHLAAPVAVHPPPAPPMN